MSQNQAHHRATELSIVLDTSMDGVLFSKLYSEMLRQGLCLSISGDEPGLHVHNLK